MKKTLVLGVLGLLLAGMAFAQAWTVGPTAPFTYVRLEGEYYPPTAKAYFLGGRVGTNTTSGRIWSFDPVAGTFADEGLDMEIPISNYSVALLNDPTGVDSLALYTVGGRMGNGTLTPALQAYYPITGLAMSLSSDPFPGRVSGTVFFPGQGTAVVNNKLYVFGGYSTSAAPYHTDSTWVYDPAQPAGSRWSVIPTARLARARAYITSAVADGKVYAIGGSYTPNGAAPLYNTRYFERFDPANPSAGWVSLVNLPDTSSESMAFGFNTGSPYGLGGHIIVTPRGGWPLPFGECYDYNIATNTWTTFPSVNTARRSHASFFVPGTGGSNGIPGMWLLGGRYDVDSPGLNSSEYYQLTYSAVEEQGGVRLVKKTELLQPTPNPFMGKTSLRYSLTQSGPVSLVIYGITGQRVRTLVSGNQAAGSNEVVWDGRNDMGVPVRAGVYFARFSADKISSTQRITVLR